MELFYRKIIGIPILADSTRALSTVSDLLIDNENGKLLAIALNSDKNKIISSMDIVKIDHDFVKINSIYSVIDYDEIIKVKSLIDNGFYIQNCRVESKNGDFLGKVFDFSLDENLLVLKKLYVAKGFLSLFRFDKRIFSWKDIYKILPGKIIIKNHVATKKQELPELQSSVGLA